jgi:hypothetical protein
MLKENKKVRGRCHNFPGYEKNQGIVRHDHHEHPGYKETIKYNEACRRPFPDKAPDISDRITDTKDSRPMTVRKNPERGQAR